MDGIALSEDHQNDHLELELSDSWDHEHDSESPDDCSPLCGCNCCHITIRPPIQITWNLSFPGIISTKLPKVKTDLHGLIDGDDIWQPPRLS